MKDDRQKPGMLLEIYISLKDITLLTMSYDEIYTMIKDDAVFRILDAII